MSNSKNNPGKLQNPNTQKSNIHNPNSHEYKAAANNKSNQKNPNYPAHPKSLIKQGKYEFKVSSLIDIRNQIGLTQGKMAEVLGVPPNTLSRWEKGLAVPDATSLAAIFSVAKEHDITPVFFSLREDIKTFPYNLLVIWDFETAGIPAYWIKNAHDTIMIELRKRFAGMTPILKAFTHSSQLDAFKELKTLGWRTVEDETEVFQYIIEDAKSDSGHNPKGTVLVLISIDNAFVDLIDDLMKKGVQVYVMSAHTYNNKLFEKVGPGHCIQWYPITLEQPKRVLKDSPGWAWGIR
jgi:transcriptional regulator with XRE-family HTH domain